MSFQIPVQNPVEFADFTQALIARGAWETRYGVHDRYGLASSRYGMTVREWPVAIVHEYAVLEDRVLVTQSALRRAQGVE